MEAEEDDYWARIELQFFSAQYVFFAQLARTST